jgi:hypothetical protein
MEFCQGAEADGLLIYTGKIMNRRTFLQSVGATLAVVAIPAKTAMAKTFKPKPQWINFVDEMPKVGQKVAVFTYFKGDSRNVLTGEVIKQEMDDRYGDIANTITIDAKISHTLDRFDGWQWWDITLHESDWFIDRRSYYYVKPEIKRLIKKASWIKRSDSIRSYYERMIVPRHGLKVSTYVGRNASYWFPITEYIPKNLPAFPKPKPLLTQRSSVTINGVKDTFVTLFKE